MAKIVKQLNPQELQAIIDTLEAAHTFESMSELYKAVAATEWAVNNELNPNTIPLRIKEFSLTTKTRPMTAEERLAKLKATPRGQRKKKESKLGHLRQVTPTKYHHYIERAEEGSTAARIALKCLDCCAFESAEVRACEIKNCSLYDIRPFQS